MVASTEAAQVLAQDARRLAEEIESLCGRLQKIDALSAIRRFMALHSEGNSQFDMIDAAKNLRSYAGILAFLGSKSPDPEIQPVPSKSRPRHTPYMASKSTACRSTSC